MCPSPAKPRDSFTFNNLMNRINYLIPAIDDFMGDIGSGNQEWKQIRKKLLMIGQDITDSNPDATITNAYLVKQYDLLKLDTLRSINFDELRTKLDAEITSHQENEKKEKRDHQQTSISTQSSSHKSPTHKRISDQSSSHDHKEMRDSPDKQSPRKRTKK